LGDFFILPNGFLNMGLFSIGYFGLDVLVPTYSYFVLGYFIPKSFITYYYPAGVFRDLDILLYYVVGITQITITM